MRAQVTLWQLCALMMRVPALLAPRVSLGPYRFPDGGHGFICLVGPTGDPTMGFVHVDTTVVQENGDTTFQEDIEPDRSLYAAADMFFRQATARGVRLAIEGLEEQTVGIVGGLAVAAAAGALQAAALAPVN